MIKVESNESRRNVAKNALAGMQLLPNAVFFGVNGAGKSTICEVISQAATLSDNRESAEEPLNVYAFDDQWRTEKVGDFVNGGSAKGVTTVKLNDGAKSLEVDIQKAKEDWEKSTQKIIEKQQQKKSIEEKQDEIVNNVAGGVRKKLEKECPSLSGARFKRPAIREMLVGGELSTLSQSEIKEKLIIAASESPGFLASLPTLPTEWSFSDSLWAEVNEIPSIKQKVLISINDWVREGLEKHKVGDSCEFCAGKVTDERIKDLTDAILQTESEVSELVKMELGNCRRYASELRKSKNLLEGMDFLSSIYSADLNAKMSEVLLEVVSVINTLEESEKILERKVKNPQLAFLGDRPHVDVLKLRNKYKLLNDEHLKATTEIEKHAQNQKLAIDQLKRHCCATDGSGWTIVEKEMKQAEVELQTAKQKEKETKQNLDKLNLQVSTTADTAKFLDDSLSLILGEKTLKVTEGEEGEGYRITRHDQKAAGMSEGEKKLVALLYFCAEFLSEDRRQLMKNSVVLFDDLGSELDEPRLLAVDRFISNHFQNPAPAVLAYFTHSHTYLKILQARLGKKALETRRGNQIIAPKAVFYEVYKDSFSDIKQSTVYRQWDDEAIKLTNDYWLSFYMVLSAFEDLRRGEVPSLGTGNFCRKVLEGFTEFRAPGDEEFGSRIDTILTARKLALSPALSKIVNGLSHSNLSKAGGVLSRNEVEHAVMQTLNFMRQVDDEHFLALLIKFRGKRDADQIKRALQERIGNS